MRDNRVLAIGVALLATGAFILLSRRFELSGPGPILLLIGFVFLAISVARRMRGPLLPGAVLVGLGAGLLLREPLLSIFPPWATFLLGLGAGFLLVAALDRSAGRERRPPPLVPGAILVAIALFAALFRAEPLRDLADQARELWPWALVIVGALLLAQALWRRKA